MKLVRIVFFIVCSSLGWCQAQTIESLFKERNFDTIVSILTKKQRIEELTFNEYFFLSRSYHRKGQYTNGYILTNEMIKKAVKTNDTVNLLKAFNLKTEHILDLEKIDEGVKLCDSITPLYKTRDSLSLMSLCFKCGLLYHYNNQSDKAYTTYQKITKKEYRNLPIFTNNLAIILKKMRKYDEALVYLSKALKYEKKRNRGLNIQYSNIAEIYLIKGKWKLAEKYMDSAYNSFDKRSRLSTKMEIFKNYYDLYGSKGNIESAGKALDSMLMLNEEILQKNIKEKIYSIEAANNKENLLVKRAKVVNRELLVSKNQILKIIPLLLFLIFLLIIGVFILKYKNIQSYYKNSLAEQQLSWTKLNPKYLSNSFDTMQEMIHNKNPKSITYLSKFSKLLRLILESSRKPLISLKEEVEAIKYYLEIQQLETEDQFVFTIEIDQDLEFLEIYIPPMLIQPFVEGAIKNCQTLTIKDPEIKVKITYDNNALVCVIIDNGIKNTNEEEFVCSKKLEALKKTREILKVFSKKLKVPSDIIIEDKNTGYTTGTKTTLILPHKNEEL